MSGFRCFTLARLVAPVFAAAALAAAPASAADFPSRPIKLVVPAPPGGAGDISARAIAEGMGAKLGQPVIVENRPGAATLLGLRAVVRDQPDGYTMALLPVTGVAIATTMYDNVPSLEKDFSYVAGVVNAPHMLVAPAGHQSATVAELVARLKAAPGRYNYASQGVGSLSHLESALFLDGSKAQAEHVPYKGSAEALPGLMSGETAFMFDSVASVRTHVAAGKLVALGTSASGRVPQFPDAPTMAELGIADLKADNPFAFVAPAGTPPAVIAALTDAVRAALEDPKIIETLTRAGMVPAFQPPKDIARIAAEDLAFWPGMARRVGAKKE
ncbi:tripartite tricarboxylate transporter substrate binding protein [Bordetella bronchiseptica]|uniref:tripartite tricarboxylate transporter substrate binding protein n=1 Tax=Bordetella bronchiseptica TaxID=518 RepID=UPI0005293DC7|nr:tripartite tricarboxylate transporter substrate binding protein [Bordetella bronchiseptica]